MPELPPIVIVMLLIACAFVMVMTLSVIRWPTIPAYFIAGMMVGPSGLGILTDSETGHFVAELGVIFLLFTIGLKFSLSSLLPIRRYVIWLGGAQTFFTAAVFGLPVFFLTDDFLLSLLVGSAAAMSSTAVVSQLLIGDNILASPAGNRAMGVLLFQDLAVIPLIVIFSSGGEGSMAGVVFWVVVKVMAVMVLVFYVGGPAMSRWLNFVARFGDKELYMLNLVMIIGLLSGLAALAGLSYALGAFVAGILMSETLHRHRVLRIVDPFRHVFLGFFFMSLGVLVDVGYLADNWPLVLAAAAGLIAIKAPLVYACARVVGSHAKTALLTTLLLSGAGEFGFVLLTLAAGEGLIEESLFQLLLSANLAALVATPFLWRHRERLIKWAGRGDWLVSASAMTANLSQTFKLSKHVLIAGYGRTGQAIAAMLRDMGTPYAALEDDYQILRSVGGADNVIYAEATTTEGLAGGGAARARVFVVSFVDPVDSKIAVEAGRRANKNMFILARADTAAMADELTAAGADAVFVDAHELGFSAAKKILKEAYGFSPARLRDSIVRARRKENPFFTGDFTAAPEEERGKDEGHSFIGCVAKTGASSLEQCLEGCRVISWTRGGERLEDSDASRQLLPGDELILAGEWAHLQDAKQKIESE